VRERERERDDIYFEEPGIILLGIYHTSVRTFSYMTKTLLSQLKNKIIIYKYYLKPSQHSNIPAGYQNGIIPVVF
jgi:hypothetical protein